MRDSRSDRKWEKLRELLIDDRLLRDDDGAPRKLIIFTEHRDTLDYLVAMIRDQLGRDDAVVTIHGGTSRRDRRLVREQFTTKPAARSWWRRMRREKASICKPHI